MPLTQDKSVKPLRLLIIEDDPDQRELIGETLEAHFGAGTVSAAASRKEAMAQELPSFDLILCDYNLPDAEGMELLAEIRARCQVPVIMVTGENVGKIATEAIRNGAADYVVKFGDYLMTIPLVVEKNLASSRLVAEREELRRELEQKNAQLEHMAATDPLTGLYNRRHFGNALEQSFAEALRYDSDLSCVMIDLDGYKQFNDTFGHQVGDQLLVLVGKGISANLRQMDMAARYGGDEFVLLLPRAGDEEAAVVADRIRMEFIKASGKMLNEQSQVTMSIGVASLKSCRAAGPQRLVAQADAALYQAKEAGRNRIVRSACAAAG
jgi:diguanylate cyclase (GGDEF)-like protein